jgi:TrmH family RNA methyltransferase
MLYPDFISSIDNSHIKKIKKIMQFPKQFSDFLVVEGDKHANEFKDSKYFRLMRWFIVDGRQHDFDWINPRDITMVSKKVMEYLSDVEMSQGIVGLFACLYDMADVGVITDQATFILDQISDPANMGALIRTAVALGRNQLICVDGVFPFSSKVVRASAGMIAHIKVIRISLNAVVSNLVFYDKKVMSLSLDGEPFKLKEVPALSEHFIVLGNEGSGIRGEYSLTIKKKVLLPMAEKAESLNVSVAGSVMGYLIWAKLA